MSDLRAELLESRCEAAWWFAYGAFRATGNPLHYEDADSFVTYVRKFPTDIPISVLFEWFDVVRRDGIEYARAKGMIE